MSSSKNLFITGHELQRCLKLGYRYKKTVNTSEQRREEVVKACENLKDWQGDCDLNQLVFLDETGLSTDMIRRYGRALGGARCRDFALAGHWKTMIFIVGLRIDGLTVPWCLDQAINGEAFKKYLRSQLGPTLKAGDIVICDIPHAVKFADFFRTAETLGSRRI